MNWIKKFAQWLLSEELAEAWAMATEFIRAQNNVLSEFREQGLL